MTEIKRCSKCGAMLDFPTVAETDVCGEYVSRAADHSCDGGYEEES